MAQGFRFLSKGVILFLAFSFPLSVLIPNLYWHKCCVVCENLGEETLEVLQKAGSKCSFPLVHTAGVVVVCARGMLYPLVSCGFAAEKIIKRLTPPERWHQLL